MAKYKVLVVASDNFGCGKFRSIDPHKMLQEMYPDLFDVDIIMHNDLYMKNRNLPEFLKPYNLIHVHKEIDRHASLIQIFKFLGKKVILDLDDHYKLDQRHPMYAMSVHEAWHEKIIKHIHYADLVTTTTDIYKDVLLKHNKNVEVLPNAINPTEKQFIPEVKESDRLRVGIICGSSHLHDIKLFEGFLKYFTKEELDSLQFVICGFDTRGSKHILNADGTKTTVPIKPEETVWYTYEGIMTDNYSIVSEDFKKKLLEFNEWSDCYSENESYSRFWTKNIKEYATHYNNIDVLLVPLVKSDFNSVKSQLKVIEAGFFKKGIIASNFGPYTLDLKNIMKKNGSLDLTGNSILIDTYGKSKDWANAVKFLLKNRDTLKIMQENLYNTVKDQYSLQEVTKKRKDIYLKLLEK